MWFTGFHHNWGCPLCVLMAARWWGQKEAALCHTGLQEDGYVWSSIKTGKWWGKRRGREPNMFKAFNRPAMHAWAIRFLFSSEVTLYKVPRLLQQKTQNTWLLSYLCLRHIVHVQPRLVVINTCICKLGLVTSTVTSSIYTFTLNMLIMVFSLIMWRIFTI